MGIRSSISRFAAQTLAQVQLSDELFRHPVFVLAPPRSGSSLLASIMQEQFCVWGSPRECDAAWRRFFPYDSEQLTDAISLERFIATTNAETMKRELLALALRGNRCVSVSRLASGVSIRDCHYLEKTIANAFRIEVINHVFPDAYYIYLYRDARENISSMLDGWRSGKFAKRLVPSHLNSPHQWWTFPYPPGWEEQMNRPLVEVCAWSWEQHHAFIQSSLSSLNLRERTVTVNYQELLDSADEVLERIGLHTNLPTRRTGSANELIERDSWSTVSKPRKDKWKDLNYEEIMSIEGVIDELEAKFQQSLAV